MRPSDPRLRVQLAPARGPLGGVAALGLVTGALVIGQAWAVAGLIVAVLDDGDVLAWGVLVAALLTARGLASGAGDVLAARAAAIVSTILRHRCCCRCGFWRCCRWGWEFTQRRQGGSCSSDPPQPKRAPPNTQLRAG